MIIYGADRSKLMEIERFYREGNTLRFSGKIMGAMPVTAVVTPQQLRQMLKSLGFSLLLFVVSMLFRRDAVATSK
jgi:hypothetical protein